MLNDISSPLALLATRRSGKPRDLVAPGPSATELDAMLAIAARVPDHGKLGPWRFVIVPDAARDAFAALLTGAQAAERGTSPGDVAAAEQFARQAPALVVVLSTPTEGKIPRWEQELSAGAACLNLLHAATAMGYAGGWLTGWPAYSPRVLAAFGAPGDRIAGFVFLGTPSRPLDERPRPGPGERVSVWTGEPI
jgi:nitroreductase